MQKKIIALAIAAAVSAPAFADTSNVTVYGVANVSYDMTNNGVVGANKVSSNTSRLGLKGSEDLGDGLSAIWQIEQLINIDNSGANTAASPANGFGTRNTFAGLSSTSAGTVLMGRHDTPYNIATRGLDLFTDTLADNRNMMGNTANGLTGHDARLTDVIAYISPAMSGFTAAIAYVAGAENTVAANTVKGSAWSMAGLYGNGPINASLAYQVIKVGTAGTGTMGGFATLGANDEAKAWKIGGGYTMDAFQLNAAYERTTNTVGGASFGDQNNYYLAGKYSFGSNAVKAAYTKAGSSTGIATSGASQWSLGYDHGLSKRTTLFALYTKVSNDAGSAYGLSTASTGVVAAAAAGQDPHAISLGLKHTF